MSRMPQVNELLRQELASLIQQELEFTEGLITITRVKCSPNLREATVLVSVLPENRSGTALKMLKKSSAALRNRLSRRLKLKTIPRLNYKIDSLERQAAELDRVYDELDDKNNGQ